MSLLSTLSSARLNSAERTGREANDWQFEETRKVSRDLQIRFVGAGKRRESECFSESDSTFAGFPHSLQHNPSNMRELVVSEIRIVYSSSLLRGLMTERAPLSFRKRPVRSEVISH
ncbi:hypothetical protein R1flu_002476 [Riccia fluitans]|uniref:Uncharacterized protein n=1 Tax=Riccia fluitans TaxID=41844 RepID=A0ABD1Y6B5_9MARC